MDKKEPKNDSNTALARFGRDKRARTVTSVTERVERRPRLQREAADAEQLTYEPKRRSYNPNFTRDNRPMFEEKHRSYGEKQSYGDRPQHTDSRPRRTYGERDFNREPDFNKDFNRERNFNREFNKERNFNRDRDFNKDFHKDFNKDFNKERDFNRDYSSFNEDRPRRPRTAHYGEDRPRNNYHTDSAEGDRPRRTYGEKPTYGTYNKKGNNSRGRNYNSSGDGEHRERSFGSHTSKGAYGDKRSNGKFTKRNDRPRTYPTYAPEAQTGAMRLNRFIAQSGLCSRREADDFIIAGVVTVNGKVVTELGTKVLPTDDVRFNDSRVEGEKKVYLVLNKPKGYVTSLDDPHAAKTVMELVKGACTERIYPVGRLDKNSLGLLLFTNDGDLTKQLTHPMYQKKKIYQVSLDKPLTRADMDRIVEGITLDDGEIHADEVSYIKDNKQEVGIEIHSGRNRIVRRIFEFLGYEVRKLDRVYYAGLTKKKLKRGAWRFLSDVEVQRLKSGLYE